MSGSLVAALSFLLFFLAYRYYSKFLAEKIFKLDPNAMTPAHELEDGLDYVPTNKYILWAHHFTSIAGAAPIVGPAIAIYWGWLPAILRSEERRVGKECRFWLWSHDCMDIEEM